MGGSRIRCVREDGVERTRVDRPLVRVSIPIYLGSPGNPVQPSHLPTYGEHFIFVTEFIPLFQVWSPGVKTDLES